MIERYENKRIAKLFSLSTKYAGWQRMELCVIEAREQLKKIPLGTYEKIKKFLEENPIDGTWIAEREKVLHHDLNAFLEERMRFIPTDLTQYFHEGMTSYDTEEAPFAQTLSAACKIVIKDTQNLLESLAQTAKKYRYTPMNARTHGQEAEMQSFGKRCLTWYQDLYVALQNVDDCMISLSYSKLSGAIGTYSGIDPDLETKALGLLGLDPWPGATQIMPRILYSPVASALSDLVTQIEKIGDDIRLGSRSGRPLWHEPFGKLQKGSSAMPHKKNNILCENIKGMARMARSYSAAIKENIVTWEERSIEQSSVERVFWPDLFHVTLRAISNMTKVIQGMVVYPDHMMIEIIESRGCYASNVAKEFLADEGVFHDLTREDAYRIVQLAAANVFEPSPKSKSLREKPAASLDEADRSFVLMGTNKDGSLSEIPSIRDVIREGRLVTTSLLEATDEQVQAWNQKLKDIFNSPETIESWLNIFMPFHILKNEAHLFKEILEE